MGSVLNLGSGINRKKEDRPHNDKVSGDDLDDVPIEHARARGSWYLLAVYVSTLAGLGWTIEAQIHLSILLILQFAVAVTGTCFFLTFNAILVDIFPQSPSTAAASSNIIRCALSAIWVAILHPLVESIGYGWYFTLWTIVVGVGVAVAVWAMERWGMSWRAARRRKLREKDQRSDLETGDHKPKPRGVFTIASRSSHENVQEANEKVPKL